MNEAIDPIEERIVSAVQRELSRFGDEIVDRIAELQDHAAAGVAERASLESEIARLVDQAADEAAARSALAVRVDELTARLVAAEDDLRGAVATTREHVERLDDSTDTRFAAAAEATDQQRNELVSVAARLDDRLTAFERDSTAAGQDIAAMMERADAASSGLIERVARFDEDRIAMDARLDRLDRRRNEAVERLDSVEARLGGIDEIVQEATVGIADRVNDLAVAHETTTKQTSDELEAIRAEMAETDAEAIEEVKERVSSALGQAELVRIEMDRFQETVKSDLDSNVSRLTAIETAVQDQRMDIETAVQLERLEEVERMVLMLDPAVVAARVSQPTSGGDTAAAEPLAEPLTEPLAEPLAAPAGESPGESSGGDASFDVFDSVPGATEDRTGAPSLPLPRLAPSSGF